MIALGIVQAVDSDGVYVLLPGSKGQVRGPYETVQSVAVGERVLVVTTDDGDTVVVGLAAASNPRTLPATSTDNAVARFDSTAGRVQGSSVVIDDNGNVSVPGSISVNGTATDNPVLTVKAQAGRTPYLNMVSLGADDPYMNWSRDNVNRFTFRCTASDFSIRSANDTGSIWGSAPYGNVFRIDRTNGRVTLGGHTSGAYTAGLEFGTGGPRDMAGTGSPEGVVSAPVGSTWRRTNGGAGTTFYVKESGTGNTGWVAK